MGTWAACGGDQPKKSRRQRWQNRGLADEGLSTLAPNRHRLSHRSGLKYVLCKAYMQQPMSLAHVEGVVCIATRSEPITRRIP